MPLTPLHLGFAWPVWFLNRKKLHFMSLTMGSMIPDLEVLPMMFVDTVSGHARGLMHSYLGAFTFDILVTMLFVFFIIPPIGRLVKRHSKEKWHIFAGVDVTRPPKDLMWALGSALIGTVSHVTIDMFTHTYNPIFWPNDLQTTHNIILFGDVLTSTLIFVVPMFIIILVLALRFWTRP
ncbi:MAG: DUF4184 family protein [Thermoplasmata archaeon]|nr:DUF4184 family protein [Thermoplasmata archaeon]